MWVLKGWTKFTFAGFFNGIASIRESVHGKHPSESRSTRQAN
jgi:hypothetical protein